MNFFIMTNFLGLVVYFIGEPQTEAYSPMKWWFLNVTALYSRSNRSHPLRNGSRTRQRGLREGQPERFRLR